MTTANDNTDQNNQSFSAMVFSEPWSVYILECADGSYYTGIAKDLEKRLNVHRRGRGARYTRSRLPLRLVYQELCSNRSQALTRECAIKTLSRIQKEEMILKNSQTQEVGDSRQS